MLNKDVNNKLLRTNFIWVLNDGTTDAVVVKQEVIYVAFFDPDNFEPHLTFLTVAELKESQDEQGLKRALFKSFEDHNIEGILNKIVYLASNGVSVNGGGLNFGLITLIKQDFDWVSFIWSFSHRLELRLKDSLKNFIKLVEEPLTSLFYLYKKPCKKLRELKLLAAVLKEIYVFQNNSICSEKVSDTRWIGHKMRAMGKLSDKFGVYAAHLGNTIADTTKQCDRATRQGKYNKLTEANIFLRRAFFFDLLLSVKSWSLSTKKENIDIIIIVNLVRITYEKYIKLEKIYSSHYEKIFEQMPTLNDVSSNTDDQNHYQEVTLKNLEHEKEYLETKFHVEQRYCDMMNKVHEDATNTVKILNSKVWPNKVSNVEEVMIKKQLSSVKTIYEKHCQLPIFQVNSFQFTFFV